MQKTAALIILSESNLAEELVAVDTKHANKTKQAKLWQNESVSAPGSVLIKTVLMKSLAEALWCTQPVYLSKQVLTTVAGRQRDAQPIKVPGTYTLLR